MIEQAIYGTEGRDGYHFLARSPGFLDDWLPEAERLCTGFGERPAGVSCPGCVFALPFLSRHIAVVAVADQGHDDAGKSLLHISAQGCVERKLGRFRPTGRSIRMLLGSCRPILQPAAAGGRVAPQFTGDCRGGPPETASNLLYGMALHLEECDLLALYQ